MCCGCSREMSEILRFAQNDKEQAARRFASNGHELHINSPCAPQLTLAQIFTSSRRTIAAGRKILTLSVRDGLPFLKDSNWGIFRTVTGRPKPRLRLAKQHCRRVSTGWFTRIARWVT